MTARRGRALEELARLYAGLPTVECRGYCAAACGPILMSRLEWGRIERKVPKGRLDPATLVCPMLDDAGRCTVYARRPLVCRLYGVAEGMECPFGCVPTRRLTKVEAFELMRKVQALSARACGSGIAESHGPYGYLLGVGEPR